MLEDKIRQHSSLAHMYEDLAHLNLEGGCIYPFLQQQISESKHKTQARSAHLICAAGASGGCYIR